MSDKKNTSVNWKKEFVDTFKDVCDNEKLQYSAVIRCFIMDYLNKNIDKISKK